jgi:TolB-like protein/DNA-binding winged helix-turn-helix (wHTH) protein/cytochrome c-type biogenesis protein CcmH/NrfG
VARPETAGETPAYLIGEWTVFPSLNRIDRDGLTADLEPKLMDLLVCLAESAGEVVSKEDLLDRVWQVAHVSDGTLSHAIAELRRALGDEARHPRYIETIRKRGYRLVAGVQAKSPAEGLVPAAGGRTRRAPRWVMAAGLVIVLVVFAWVGLRHATDRSSEPSRIVVLPFESLGGEADDSFAAGLSDEIISRLAAVRGLQVVSRTTAFSYDTAGKSARDVGRDLGVEYILEGAVRWGLDRDPPTVRITPQLIRVADDGHLWSAAFDRRPEDILDVQSEIARQIVAQLDLRMERQEGQVVGTPPTDSPDAYRAYLKALARRGSMDSQDLFTTVQMYRLAVEADPGFAQAWAGLAEVNGAIHHHGYDRAQERCESAREALDQAQRLAPSAPETMRAGATFEYNCRDNPAAAKAAFGKSLARWPGDALAMRGMAASCRRLGDFDGAETWFRRALELDPRNPTVLFVLGAHLTYLHRYGEAMAIVDRAVEISPDNRLAHFARFELLLLGWGDVAGAAEVLERAPGPRDAIWYEYAFRNACFADDFRRASSLIAESPPGPSSLLHRCLAASLAGDARATEICGDAVVRYRAMRDEQPASQSPRVLLAKACSFAGYHDKALIEAKASVSMRPRETDALGHTAAVTVTAQILGRAGRIEEAVALVEELLTAPSGVSPAILRIDPEWASLRGHPRIEEIIHSGARSDGVHGVPFDAGG